MDKARRPHVIRTWRVERTKIIHRQPQPVRTPSHPFSNPRQRTGRMPAPPAAPPEKAG